MFDGRLNVNDASAEPGRNRGDERDVAMCIGGAGICSETATMAKSSIGLGRFRARSGSLLSDLTGRPLEEIFVYAYQGTIPTQIPFQIDEREMGGM